MDFFHLSIAKRKKSIGDHVVAPMPMPMPAPMLMPAPMTRPAPIRYPG